MPTTQPSASPIYPFATVTIGKHPSAGWPLVSVRQGGTPESRRIFNRICQSSGEPSNKTKSSQSHFSFDDDDDDVKEDIVVWSGRWWNHLLPHPSCVAGQWKWRTSSGNPHIYSVYKSAGINHWWPLSLVGKKVFTSTMSTYDISYFQFIFPIYSNSRRELLIGKGIVWSETDWMEIQALFLTILKLAFHYLRQLPTTLDWKKLNMGLNTITQIQFTIKNQFLRCSPVVERSQVDFVGLHLLFSASIAIFYFVYSPGQCKTSNQLLDIAAGEFRYSVPRAELFVAFFLVVRKLKFSYRSEGGSMARQVIKVSGFDKNTFKARRRPVIFLLVTGEADHLLILESTTLKRNYTRSI